MIDLVNKKLSMDTGKLNETIDKLDYVCISQWNTVISLKCKLYESRYMYVLFTAMLPDRSPRCSVKDENAKSRVNKLLKLRAYLKLYCSKSFLNKYREELYPLQKVGLLTLQSAFLPAKYKFSVTRVHPDQGALPRTRLSCRDE